MNSDHKGYLLQRTQLAIIVSRERMAELQAKLKSTTDSVVRSERLVQATQELLLQLKSIDARPQSVDVGMPKKEASRNGGG